MTRSVSGATDSWSVGAMRMPATAASDEPRIQLRREARFGLPPTSISSERLSTTARMSMPILVRYRMNHRTSTQRTNVPRVMSWVQVT